MDSIAQFLDTIDDFVWGPAMLALMMGTGIFLTIRTRFLGWRNLGYALKSGLGKEARKKSKDTGDISPFSALTTSLASTIGTGNIVGVATAMVAGGPGALIWMWLSAFFGITSKFSECMLAVKYREVNANGEMTGGPMYTMKNAFSRKKLGKAMGWLFAFFAVIASFGIGNLTQANSITEALHNTFGWTPWIVGIVLTLLSLFIIVGGIKSISKVSQWVVPLMAAFYMLAGLAVIVINIKNVPDGVAKIVESAFSLEAAGGAGVGIFVTSMMNAMRYGVARGVFSNEAGMGSAAITASAATTDIPARQGYINMTGTFWDTIVVCTITGLCIASSGVLDKPEVISGAIKGAGITIAAFETALGPAGAWFVTIGIAMFAFSTILGWEYQGEKAFEYIVKSSRYNMIYRLAFSFVVYVGSVTTLTLVWSFSDIANALMAIPNLICLLALSKEIADEMKGYQPVVKASKKKKKASKEQV